MMRSLLLLVLLVSPLASASADEVAGEYKVVILQGIAGGVELAKQERGLYVDSRRTRVLNELAAEGWEIVSVIGASGGDHTLYLRRQTR